MIALSGVDPRPENTAVTSAPVATTSPEPAAATPGRCSAAPASAPQAAATSPARAAPPVQRAPEPVKPPEPKKYVLSAGTPITVRTVGEVNTKAAKNGNQFDATLESPLVAEGHTVAKRGATVVGRVVNAGPGRPREGQGVVDIGVVASASGKRSNRCTPDQHRDAGSQKRHRQEREEDGNRNRRRRPSSEALRAAGRARRSAQESAPEPAWQQTLRPRGPAAEIPAETVLNFSLASDLVVTEKP